MVRLVDNGFLVIVQGLKNMNKTIVSQINSILSTLGIQICHDYQTHPLADVQLLHVTGHACDGAAWKQ